VPRYKGEFRKSEGTVICGLGAIVDVTVGLGTREANGVDWMPASVMGRLDVTDRVIGGVIGKGEITRACTSGQANRLKIIRGTHKITAIVLVWPRDFLGDPCC